MGIHEFDPLPYSLFCHICGYPRSNGIHYPPTANLEHSSKADTIEFKPGLLANFYGVDGNFFKLNDTVFEAVEDECDDYRSELQEVRVIALDTPHEKLIFFNAPIAGIVVHEIEDEGTSPYYSDSFRGYELRDIGDGHVWLRFGTVNYGDYYPMFVWTYTPREAGLVYPEKVTIPAVAPPKPPKPVAKKNLLDWPLPKAVKLAPKQPRIVIDMTEVFEPTGRKFRSDI